MRRRKQSQGRGLLFVALLTALVLQLWPLFGGVALWRPQFVLLVLTFALIYRPDYYGIATAWAAGLVMDAVTGGVFGRYALALGICAYLLHLFRQRLLHAHVWHQSGLVFLLVAMTQLVVMSINTSAGSGTSWTLVWYPAITSALLWPLFYTLMMRLTRR
ncbi:rod shape-determining protein MreD [Porticoccus sp. W117]|uniref:rod shape-determining protein MreD n=1 Tax=Porticoccus sp. W117 TaxID=3054777 RepID=UPI00259A4AA1|nr:rod shape-determining protein MreD [Porticoccus sp. W117]MDM3871731.1 rod shape-determining protein MreD [Porticoccus sp. W117]